MLNFYFLEKSLRLDFLPHFECHFSRKIFLMLYSIKSSNFIVSLSLLPEILGNMCSVIISSAVDDIIDSEIKNSFFIRPFPYMTKKVRTNI